MRVVRVALLFPPQLAGLGLPPSEESASSTKIQRAISILDYFPRLPHYSSNYVRSNTARIVPTTLVTLIPKNHDGPNFVQKVYKFLHSKHPRFI